MIILLPLSRFVLVHGNHNMIMSLLQEQTVTLVLEESSLLGSLEDTHKSVRDILVLVEQLSKGYVHFVIHSLAHFLNVRHQLFNLLFDPE